MRLKQNLLVSGAYLVLTLQTVHLQAQKDSTTFQSDVVPIFAVSYTSTPLPAQPLPTFSTITATAATAPELILPTPVYLQLDKLSVAEYINRYQAIAIAEMQRTGVPASITLAQGILESRFGNSGLTQTGKNHFGILCHQWKGNKFHITEGKKKYCYRAYHSDYASFIDHSNFLSSRPHYAFLFEKAMTDYVGWAYGLKKAGYAEDADYAEKLIQIINTYQLQKFDKLLTSTPEQLERCSEKIIATPSLYNGTKTVMFDCDVSIEQIAKGYKIKPSQVVSYNNFSPDQVVKAHTLVFLEAPKSKGPKGINQHIVQKTETMESVARLYGIQIDKLYRRNKVLHGTQPKAGQTLALNQRTKQTPETYNTQRNVGKKNKAMVVKYVVKEGDTLYSISRRYNISVLALRMTNDLDSNEIKVKQKLKIALNWP
ncbi:MAG: LysM peptidoglycan-binding domain-containing protein [Chitinophagales bacterium]|jgi:flagellum-specific peptidoglycan hydrolase FlgJ/LysM repeat protein|nr:LysM peptidoglycan-binding domain-containing protein [Chitinophagales bacterium]